MKIILSLFILVFALSGCFGQKPKSSVRPERFTVVGPYLHQPSGFSFPEKSGEFVRGVMTQYDGQGEDVAIGYNIPDKSKPINVTVYIYPSPPITSILSEPSTVEVARARLCKQEFESRKKEITASHPSARLIQSSQTEAKKHYSVFEFEEEFANVRQPLSSELELTCYVNDKWTVKYRITYPKTLNVEREVQGLKSILTRVRNGS